MSALLLPPSPEIREELDTERQILPHVRVKTREELVQDKVAEILGDNDELNELIHSTGTLDELSSFLRGNDDAIWYFKKRVTAAAKALAERTV